MTAATPWGQFPDRASHPDLAAAWRRLRPEAREAAEVAIGQATRRMHALLNHTLLEPLPWPGLPDAVASSVDIAERTFLAMGVFRLEIAGHLGTHRTELADALDQAADTLDTRALTLALRPLQKGHPPLGQLKPANAAAYQQLLSQLVALDGDRIWDLAEAQGELGRSLDVALESGLKLGVLASIVTNQEDVRQQVRRVTAEKLAGSPVPTEAAAALWLLAARGLGHLFGEDDKTLAYAD